MSARARAAALAAWVSLASPVMAAAEDGTVPKTTGSLAGYAYAMRDQPDFGVAVAAINRGPLRIEARYNYEARNATSVLAGWKFAGGDDVAYEVTPLAGVLDGSVHAGIAGLEASIAVRKIDFYLEAEYVVPAAGNGDNYFYAWSELGWRPVEWLRVGLAAQRTRIVHTDRDLQRGAFAQVTLGNATLSAYAFNPEAASRYAIVSVAFAF